MNFTAQQINEYRLEWKLELMKEFYTDSSGRDLDTTNEQAFQRWLRMKFAEMK
jgi:hypothetical protein